MIVFNRIFYIVIGLFETYLEMIRLFYRELMEDFFGIKSIFSIFFKKILILLCFDFEFRRNICKVI